MARFCFTQFSAETQVSIDFESILTLACGICLLMVKKTNRGPTQKFIIPIDPQIVLVPYCSHVGNSFVNVKLKLLWKDL